MYQPFEGDDYRPINWRRRVLIAVLAVATACALLLYMLGRRGDILQGRVPAAQLPNLPADVAACKPGQSAGCVGGMASILPATGSPSAPRTAASSTRP